MIIARGVIPFLYLFFIFFLVSCQSGPPLRPNPVSPEQFHYLANLQVDNGWEFRNLAPLKISPTFLDAQGLNERVQFWLNYFTKRDRERLVRFIRNGNHYRDVVEKVFVRHGLPQDLYFLGLIESGYQLRIKSRAKALGPWQFMADTAKRYGLRVDRHIDERRSLFKSTEAAARYLKELFLAFGSWELAVSGYNAGENRIYRAVKEGGTLNYYKLCKMGRLPKETCNYVPKILASKIIDDNISHYRLQEAFIDNRKLAIAQSRGERINNKDQAKNNDDDKNDDGYDEDIPASSFKFYHLSASMAVKEVAKMSGLSVKKLKHCNPDILSDQIKVNRGTFRLYLPPRAYEQFAFNIGKYRLPAYVFND